MHRVLSFQMARGFGETSEFVTKRMCFSFLFSVGFLCLLCGFLIGRFAAGRAIDIRAEKTRLQLAGNGLENNEHLREFLVERIRENSFATSYVTDRRDEEDVRRIKNALLDLKLFHRVVGNRSCIAGTIRGSHEPDRYVVLSAIDEGISVVVELSKALKFLNEDFDWKPRRTIILLISLESSEACHAFIKNQFLARVVAYIELNVKSISAGGYFVTTGTDIVQSSILQASTGVKNPNDNNQLGESLTTTAAAAAADEAYCREIVCLGFIPRLSLDIPNAVITFVSSKNSSSNDKSTKIINAYRRGIGEVIGTCVWRLSEMTLFKWDPRDDNDVLIKILVSLNNTVENRNNIEALVDGIEKMTKNIENFNEKIELIETTKSVEVRMANDLSMQLRRLFLCNDENLRSRTDWLWLRKIHNVSTITMENYLRQLSLCYENVNELLEEDVT